jgi:sulfatase maturation enzyme AslB (radical SAM superfamily)
MATNNLSLTNDWGLCELTKNHISLDDLAKKYNLEDLDFIKIDTDGADRNVLESAKNSIHNSPVLGIWIEINFIGDQYSPNSFHAIDRTLREWGFELFDINSRKYSVASLPTPFEYDCFAQNMYGKVQQGDALYLRDPLGANSNSPKSPELSVDKLLKLACLFEIFNLPDHAAELLTGYREKFDSIIDVDENLNLLTEQVTGRKITYENYIKSITPESLLPDGIYGRNFSIENEYRKILRLGNSISKKLIDDRKIIEEDFYVWRTNFNNASPPEFRLLAHASFNLDTIDQQYKFIKRYTKHLIKSSLVKDDAVFLNYFLNLWEYVNGETMLESYPWNIAIPISDLCNARCTFCNSWLKGTGVVSVDDLSVYEEPIKHARIITLQGHGEPLVNPNIDKILRKISEWTSYMCRTSIITNGSKLSEKLNLLLASRVEVFNISLNAASSEVHDIVMGLGFDAFDRIINDIKTLVNLRKQGRNLDITLSLVLTKDNLHETVKFIELAHELEVDKIYIRSLLSNNDPVGLTEDEIEKSDPRNLMTPGLNYHLISPTMHPDHERLFDEILEKVNNSTIHIECQPETWKAQLFGKNIQKLIDTKWNEIKFISREDAIANKDIRLNYKEENKKIIGNGSFVNEVDQNRSYNPYNRKPKFDCKFVYHNLLSFETNLRLSPCCYMVDVPGHEPIVMENSNFKSYWNSDAMVNLRKSLNSGPLFELCKTCSWQG